jgi:putative two-component system response regulator
LTIGFMITAMLAFYVAMGIHHRVHLEERVKEQTADIRSAQDDVLNRLASAAQCRDVESSQRVRRVGLMCQALARHCDWFGEELDTIRQAAPLLDMGKIGVPDAILRKTTEWTPEELEIFQGHARLGGEILAGSKIPMLQMAHDIALYHHEQWDGKGYPRGLSGKDIPECARIAAIVDAYDTLAHGDAAHPPKSEDEIIVEMQQESGKRFDPMMLATFVRYLSEFRHISQRFPDRHRGGADISKALPVVGGDFVSYSPTPSAFG